MVEYVKVKNGNQVKTIQKKDLPTYIAMGWVEEKAFNINEIPMYQREK